ncbi:hypothetical protein WA158_000277 [Blastocystis sp. Blastoise]
MSKRFSKDIVVDEKGKRKFHGAFTGGFDTDYYNSAYDGENFTPSSFISSRNSRHVFNQQNSTDFMDEQDKKNAYTNLRVKEPYKDNKNSKTNPVSFSSNTFKDSNSTKVIVKEYGLGYDPSKIMKRLTNNESSGQSFLRMSDINNTTGASASRFGLSALEDDDEDTAYSSTPMSFYNQRIGDDFNRIEDIPSHKSSHSHRSSKNVCSDGYKPVSGFILSSKNKQKHSSFLFPSIPKDYIPKHIFKQLFVPFWIIPMKVPIPVIYNDSHLDNQLSTEKMIQQEQVDLARKEIQEKLKNQFKSKFIETSLLTDEGEKKIQSAVKPKTEINCYVNE